jgi:sulfide:quinone oxidoreductase
MAEPPSSTRHHRVLIVGGTAGLTVAAVLLRQRPGLDVALLEPSGDHWYQPGWTLASATWEAIDAFRGGTAIFTVPETPIKCGGAPQKVMVLADDVFKRRSGVGVNTRVIFATAGDRVFAVPAFERVLKEVMHRRGIEGRLRHRLTAVHPERQEAVFAVREGGAGEGVVERFETIPFDLLHAVPAPPWRGTTPAAGWRWTRTPPGTCASPTCSPSAMPPPCPRPARYDGYSVCPIPTGYGNVVMAEFDYGGQPVSSFLVDPTRERWSLWLLKTRLLPWLYWHRVLRGRPHEGRYLRFLAPLVHWLRLDYRPRPGDDAPAGEGCG